MKGDCVDHGPGIPVESFAEAMAKVTEIILDGLRHGFFEMSVSCDIEGGRRRVLTVKSGKSYRYNIPFDQISEIESRGR
jgi:hypothetical protein